jgi:hypothetical protein
MRRREPRLQRTHSLKHVMGVLDQVAPCRISWLQPWARGSSGEPGTAMTSRPASAARRAVMSEPDFGAASTTTVPPVRPAMIRLR